MVGDFAEPVRAEMPLVREGLELANDPNVRVDPDDHIDHARRRIRGGLSFGKKNERTSKRASKIRRLTGNLPLGCLARSGPSTAAHRSGLRTATGTQTMHEPPPPLTRHNRARERESSAATRTSSVLDQQRDLRRGTCDVPDARHDSDLRKGSCKESGQVPTPIHARSDSQRANVHDERRQKPTHVLDLGSVDEEFRLCKALRGIDDLGDRDRTQGVGAGALFRVRRRATTCSACRC